MPRTRTARLKAFVRSAVAAFSESKRKYKNNVKTKNRFIKSYQIICV